MDKPIDKVRAHFTCKQQLEQVRAQLREAHDIINAVAKLRRIGDTLPGVVFGVAEMYLQRYNVKS